MSAFLGSGRARVRSSQLQGFSLLPFFPPRGGNLELSLSLTAARNLSPRCFCSFLEEKPSLLSGMLAAHVRRGAACAPRLFPRLRRPLHPLFLRFPPGFASFGAEPRPGEGLGGAAAARLAPGRGWARSCGGWSARSSASFICVWKGSTAPSPSKKNNEIWQKLRSVCLSSVPWLILCGYKCSSFIILLFCLQAFTVGWLCLELGLACTWGRVRGVPSYTRRRAPLPKSRSPPDFPLPHLKLSEGSGVIAPCESWERGWIC